MIEITLSRVTDFTRVEQSWRRLEQRARGSFFQTWTWMGCLAEERFADPVLLEARAHDETVALALFNRRRGLLRESLFLGESGEPFKDSPYIEFNGVLVADGAQPEVMVACLRGARRTAVSGRPPLLGRRVVLSGIDDAGLAAARLAGSVQLRQSLAAPRIDLHRLRQSGRDFLDGLSANTRYQLRRSDRAYAAIGPLSLRRAETAPEAHAFLDELIALHQASWKARGRRGAFAEPFFRRFHHALVDRGMPRGEIDLLRVTAGDRVVGVLYNFRQGGHALAYQSGFNYAAAGRHQKPGLTSHHQAIQFCCAQGLVCYDLLAGDDRYKRSLADGAARLYWAELGKPWLSRLTGKGQRLPRLSDGAGFDEEAAGLVDRPRR